jgi:hypothetical protein
LESLWKYVARDDIHIEPTYILDLDGRMAQLVDAFTKADCQYKANGFAASVETQDRGSATLASTPWSPEQVEQLAGVAAWMHLHPRIRLPLTPATKWDGTGIGPHRQFPEWSVYQGKTCPGDARVAQIPQILALANEIAYSTSPEPPTPEESEVRYVVLQATGRPELLTAMDGAGITVVGFASPSDRDTLIKAFNATACPVSPGQFDEFVARAGS